ncbi:hypothetical protein X975_21837, partial [Stegodyphus mimosarum]
MFDVFQNVLFGKKKSNAESEKEKSDTDDFVLIGQSSNEQVSVKESESSPHDPQFPKNPYQGITLGEDALSSTKCADTNIQIMPLQGVPFVINANLYASAKLDQIWQGIAPSIATIGHSSPYREDYDFSLEKSVISETA